MIGKYFTETSNKVELRINLVRINHVRPVKQSEYQVCFDYSPADYANSYEIFKQKSNIIFPDGN